MPAIAPVVSASPMATPRKALLARFSISLDAGTLLPDFKRVQQPEKMLMGGADTLDEKRLGIFVIGLRRNLPRRQVTHRGQRADSVHGMIGCGVNVVVISKKKTGVTRRRRLPRL